MSIFDFFNRHEFLAFLALCFVYFIIVRIVRMPALIANGWPPSDATHICDADGDWHKREEADE